LLPAHGRTQAKANPITHKIAPAGILACSPSILSNPKISLLDAETEKTHLLISIMYQFFGLKKKILILGDN
jgi:hypothetical protein